MKLYTMGMAGSRDALYKGLVAARTILLTKCPYSSEKQLVWSSFGLVEGSKFLEQIQRAKMDQVLVLDRLNVDMIPP